LFQLNIQKNSKTTLFNTTKIWDLLIIGGGPAGLNAALYAQRKGLLVGLITKEIGGQLHNTTSVENYLGFEYIEGASLSQSFHKHVKSLDIPILVDHLVTNLEKNKEEIFELTLDNNKSLKAKTVLFATGASPRKLGIEGEDTFASKGVSYCTTCDAPFFKGKHVIVAGGGNSAAEAVLDLSVWASKITVVHRSQWRADQILLDKLNELDHVTVRLNTNLVSVGGKEKMESVIIFDKMTQENEAIKAEGLFVEIGIIPNTGLLVNKITMNQQKEIIVDESLMTSMPGLFAAGDVTTNRHKQIIIAASDGAKAALSIQTYLRNQTKGEIK